MSNIKTPLTGELPTIETVLKEGLSVDLLSLKKYQASVPTRTMLCPIGGIG